VQLHLIGAEAVRSAAEVMARRLASAGAAPTGFQVQRMIPSGVEMIVGLTHDSQFGPLVAVGAGGVTVELLKDVAVRLTPLSRADAREMLRSLKTYPLLEGYRGAPAADLAAVEDAVLRLSALAEDLPQVVELDCNPLIALERGATIADVRVRVEAVEPAPPLGARR
jgi:acyl-CoA synthetase (NDP forming)